MDLLESKLVNNKVWWRGTLALRNLAARCAVFYTFMLEGVFMGVWSYYLVDIQHRVDLSDSDLGSAVLFVSFGMVVVSPLTSFLLNYFGSKTSMFVGALTYGISLSFIPLAGTYYSLVLTMLFFGLTMGVMDISMNSCAILTEIVAGRSLFGGFHGSYSIAAAMGSIIAEVLSANDEPILGVFIIMSFISIVLTVVFHSNMYNHPQEAYITEYKNFVIPDDVIPTLPPTTTATTEVEDMESDIPYKRPTVGAVLSKTDEFSPSADVPTAASPTATLAFYSAVGFLASFGESSVVTWSIVYFHREMHASELLKSLGFICFMVCMALGRFGSDLLRAWLGRRWMVCMGGILAFLGLSLVAISPDFPHAIIVGSVGFSITGMGLSTLIPTMFSSAGHIPGGAHAGTSIAIVSMFTNCGAIISSPLVGYLSDGLGSMRQAFFCDAVLLGLICVLSWGIPEESSIFKRNSSTLNKTE